MPAVQKGVHAQRMRCQSVGVKPVHFAIREMRKQVDGDLEIPGEGLIGEAIHCPIVRVEEPGSVICLLNPVVFPGHVNGKDSEVELPGRLKGLKNVRKNVLLRRALGEESDHIRRVCEPQDGGGVKRLEQVCLVLESVLDGEKLSVTAAELTLLLRKLGLQE